MHIKYGSAILLTIALLVPVWLPRAIIDGHGQISEPNQLPIVLVEQDAKAGLERWRTALGPLWIPTPGYYVMSHLEWEGTIQKVYEHPLAQVRKGDVVIDCGAHIGFVSLLALRAGAQVVVAIEPEQANVRALRRNLEQQLKRGQVKLVEKGVWDRTGKLALHLSRTGDSHSAVVATSGPGDATMEITTVDALVESLKLPRVDFIKMDIEGAEQKALQGARQTIARWRPRLAISSYHLEGDPAAICRIVWEARSDYMVAAKNTTQSPRGAVPKVLFFY